MMSSASSTTALTNEEPFRLAPHRLGYAIRLRLGKGARRRLVIPVRERDEAQRRALELRHIAHILVTSGHADLAERFVRVAASAEWTRLLEIKAKAIAVSVGRAAPVRRKDSPVTFAQLAERWTSGVLHRTFPHHVRPKKSVADDISRLKRLNRLLGHVSLAKFSLTDAQRAMRSLPSDLSPATRRQYAQLIATVLKLAVFPCGIISVSPLPSGWLPRVKPGTSKARTILYPDEESQLLQCSDIPLRRRLLYAFLAREGCRLSEATQLAWDDIDLDRGLVALGENKTNDPRVWALGSDVVRALRAYKLVSHALRPPFDGHETTRMAALLRRDLTTAGINRSALFERSDMRVPFRLHDLRGTFITLALANGRSETWVCDRTGHRSSVMVNRYRRQARTAVEVGMGWFGEMDELLGLRRRKA